MRRLPTFILLTLALPSVAHSQQTFSQVVVTEAITGGEDYGVTIQPCPTGRVCSDMGLCMDTCAACIGVVCRVGLVCDGGRCVPPVRCGYPNGSLNLNASNGGKVNVGAVNTGSVDIGAANTVSVKAGNPSGYTAITGNTTSIEGTSSLDLGTTSTPAITIGADSTITNVHGSMRVQSSGEAVFYGPALFVGNATHNGATQFNGNVTVGSGKSLRQTEWMDGIVTYNPAYATNWFAGAPPHVYRRGDLCQLSGIVRIVAPWVRYGAAVAYVPNGWRPKIYLDFVGISGGSSNYLNMVINPDGTIILSDVGGPNAAGTWVKLNATYICQD